MTKANGEPHGETWRGRKEGRRESERWTSWFRGVAGEARGRPTPVLSVFCFKVRSCRSETGQLTGKFVATIWLFYVFLLPFCGCLSLSASHTPLFCLPTWFSFHPPVLHQFIWHIPVLIVQAQPLALFKICIRMLFLYSSKRRHVEPLLNCSANRWRFSRCLYEIKWNIPLKKRHFPLSLHPSLSHFLSVLPFSSLSFCLHLLLFYFFFFFCLVCLRLGQRHATAESEVESRQVCVTNNCFPRQESEH